MRLLPAADGAVRCGSRQHRQQRELDLRVELTVCDFDALVPAIQSGKADVASGCMNITEEKRKNVDFSDPYC